jgi:hypothetical protein
MMHHHGKPPLSISGSGSTGTADSAPHRETRLGEHLNLAEDARTQNNECASLNLGSSNTSRFSRRFIYGGRIQKIRRSDNKMKCVLKVWK